MKNLEDKYIDLLLNRCINFKHSKSLLISYIKENQDFIDKLVKRANQMGIYDVYLYDEDPYQKHEILKTIELEDIKTHPFFNKKIWDEYALKHASFLIFETEIPHLMDDISSEKLTLARYIDRATRSIFKKKQLSFEIPWCIAVLPNEKWAKELFPNEENPYDNFFKIICQMCMVDTPNPIESWNRFLKSSDEIVHKLDLLEIKKMHYKNKLGTDLVVEFADNIIWSSAGNLGEDMLVNCPSYEVFTTPNLWKTEGIVYSSLPLSYNGGIVDEFFLEFKHGKVVNYDAKVGKEILTGIIESDKYSSYLGETALVNYNSPISNTGLIFSNTLFDENSRCHFALGNGFEECIKNRDQLTAEQLLEIGVNPSKNHVDFMIGTEDLEIEAETNKGKVLIFKNGNFNI